MPLTNGFILGPYTNIWAGKTEVPDVFSRLHIRVVQLHHSHKDVPNQTTNTV